MSILDLQETHCKVSRSANGRERAQRQRWHLHRHCNAELPNSNAVHKGTRVTGFRCERCNPEVLRERSSGSMAHSHLSVPSRPQAPVLRPSHAGRPLRTLSVCVAPVHQRASRCILGGETAYSYGHAQGSARAAQARLSPRASRLLDGKPLLKRAATGRPSAHAEEHLRTDATAADGAHQLVGGERRVGGACARGAARGREQRLAAGAALFSAAPQPCVSDSNAACIDSASTYGSCLRFVP